MTVDTRAIVAAAIFAIGIATGAGHLVFGQPTEDPVVTAAQAQSIKETRELIGDAEVILFSASWCGYCDKAREYLEISQVDYLEVDVELDEIARMQFDRLGAKAVPTLIVGNHVLFGFNGEKISHALVN